ncbi:MAG: glycine--tRNA ligase [Halobacteriota archaeon]
MSDDSEAPDLYDEVVELSKRRGYLYPAFEIYGGVSGFWDYGPLGTGLKNNVVESWRELYVVEEGFEEIETTTVGSEDVYLASGHVDGFADLLVNCTSCGEYYRADHLVEDHTEIENADGMTAGELQSEIDELGIPCRRCGETIAGEVTDFNLMFETNIGPGDARPGYLRPETAQGIFVDLHRLKRYYRETLPFGVTQVGRAYRNEINPRQGVVRLREFNQMELEYFKHPERERSLDGLEDVELRLYPVEQQRRDDGDVVTTTAGEAVEDGVIESPTIAGFVAQSQTWYESIGVDPERLRFRQHLPDERAHYASDCWDGEALTSHGWIELNGVADRGSYDLERHAERSGEELGVFVEFDEARVTEEAVVDPDMSVIGPEYGDVAPDVVEALERLVEGDPGAFDGDVVEVEVDGETIEVDVADAGFEVRETRREGENVLPQVVEPSYGLDRIVYTVLEHSFDRDKPESSEDERRVLRLPPAMAPYDVAVFPLVSKDGLDELARDVERRLRREGFMVSYDDSGAIGRRYRRHDEIGTPFSVTVDYESKEDASVTIRDRDSTEQHRVAVDELSEALTEAL